MLLISLDGIVNDVLIMLGPNIYVGIKKKINNFNQSLKKTLLVNYQVKISVTRKNTKIAVGDPFSLKVKNRRTNSE